MTKLARRYLISGKVQQVYFRQSTLREAETLGVSGWVRNLPDGRVEVTAYADLSTLQKFEAWLQVGPKMARVEQVATESADAADPPIAFTQRATPATV